MKVPLTVNAITVFNKVLLSFFFIKIEDSKIVKNKKIFNSKFREGRDKNGKLNFLDKKKSLRKIKDKFVFDINSKKNKKIVDLNLLA